MKTYKNFKYKINEGEIEITGIIESRQRLRIPEMIEGLKVTSIGDWAFRNNQLTSVSFPESLTSIGDWAFRNNQLTSVSFPESLTSIGDSAFENNVELIKGNQRIKMIDGIATVLRKKKRKIESFEIFEGKFFNTSKKCFVAKREDYTAHGETIRQAIEDVNFKFMQESMEVSEIIDEVRNTKKLTISQFRLITGACRTGYKNFLQSKNLSEVTELPLSKALDVLKGQFGWERIKEAFV